MQVRKKMKMEHVIIVILLLYVIYKLHKMASEQLNPGAGYLGTGLANLNGYDSGADLRFATQFSSTDQGNGLAQTVLNTPAYQNAGSVY